MEQYTPTIEKENLESLLFLYKNVIPGHHQLIPYIEQVVEGGMASWDTVEILGNQVKTMSFPYPQEFKDPNDFSVTFEERISLVTAGFLGFVEKDFVDNNRLPDLQHDQIGLMKYETGTSFSLNSPTGNDSIAVIYFLNDDYEGGILNFENLGVTYQPKANEALILPLSEAYQYSISEVTSGTKYAIITYLRAG